MKLIIGGAYQGKLTYVLEKYQVDKDEIYHASETCSELPGDKKVVYHLEQWVMACQQERRDALELLNVYLQRFPDAVLICEDVSCGVVPADPMVRQWREAVGRCTAALSQRADEVVRLFCGIPAKLK